MSESTARKEELKRARERMTKENDRRRKILNSPEYKKEKEEDLRIKVSYEKIKKPWDELRRISSISSSSNESLSSESSNKTKRRVSSKTPIKGEVSIHPNAPIEGEVSIHPNAPIEGNISLIGEVSVIPEHPAITAFRKSSIQMHVTRKGKGRKHKKTHKKRKTHRKKKRAAYKKSRKH
jgi:UDP-3-O-[3-hydroxymyristoyl] glucosamine N-acyltransferase